MTLATGATLSAAISPCAAASGASSCTPPAATLARMASVTGVTPAQLEAIGRDDAAVILRAILEDARREAEVLAAAVARADDAFLRTLGASPVLTAAKRAEYARMWAQGGRQAVEAVTARLLRRLGD